MSCSAALLDAPVRAGGDVRKDTGPAYHLVISAAPAAAIAEKYGLLSDSTDGVADGVADGEPVGAS